MRDQPIQELSPFLRIGLLSSLVAVGAYVADRFRRGERLPIPTREIRLVAVLFWWALLTVPFSYWPGGSLEFLLGFFLKTIVIFWLLSVTVTTQAQVRRVAWVLTLLAVPLATGALYDYVSGKFYGAVQRRITGFEASLTSNPNDLALMLNLILSLTIALSMIQRSVRVRGLLLGIIALEVVAVIATFSRAGFLTLATIVTSYVWIKRAGVIWIVILLALAPVGASLLPSGYLDRLGTITHIDADPTGSAQNRWSDTVTGLHFAVRHPIIGAGAGMNVLALNEERGAAWLQIHNVFLQYAIDLGILGLVLFLCLYAACLKSVTDVQRRCAREPAERELYWLATGLRVSLMAFGLAAIFHPVGYELVFYYFGGLAIALRSVPGATPTEAPAIANLGVRFSTRRQEDTSRRASEVLAR